MNIDTPPELLSSLTCGRSAHVLSIAPCPLAVRLREMGLFEGSELEVLCDGDPMICRLGACRVGICARLASEIQVTPLNNHACP